LATHNATAAAVRVHAIPKINDNNNNDIENICQCVWFAFICSIQLLFVCVRARMFQSLLGHDILTTATGHDDRDQLHTVTTTTTAATEQELHDSDHNDAEYSEWLRRCIYVPSCDLDSVVTAEATAAVAVESKSEGNLRKLDKQLYSHEMKRTDDELLEAIASGTQSKSGVFSVASEHFDSKMPRWFLLINWLVLQTADTGIFDIGGDDPDSFCDRLLGDDGMAMCFLVAYQAVAMKYCQRHNEPWLLRNEIVKLLESLNPVAGQKPIRQSRLSECKYVLTEMIHATIDDSEERKRLLLDASQSHRNRILYIVATLFEVCRRYRNLASRQSSIVRLDGQGQGENSAAMTEFNHWIQMGVMLHLVTFLSVCIGKDTYSHLFSIKRTRKKSRHDKNNINDSDDHSTSSSSSSIVYTPTCICNDESRPALILVCSQAIDIMRENPRWFKLLTKTFSCADHANDSGFVDLHDLIEQEHRHEETRLLLIEIDRAQEQEALRVARDPTEQAIQRTIQYCRSNWAHVCKRVLILSLLMILVVLFIVYSL